MEKATRKPRGLILCLVTGFLAALSCDAPQSRPNILIVVTDDQPVQGSMQAMPRTQSWLGDGGKRFLHAHATTPLCCPSRASIFTGRYAHSHGITTNKKGPDFDSGRALQRYLSDVGYRTGLVGKFLNNWPISRRPPYFDRWVMVRGEYFRFKTNDNGAPGRIENTYVTDYLTEAAVETLHAFEARDEAPWLLVVATKAAHAPVEVHPAFRTAPIEDLEVTPSLWEKDVSDKPPFLRFRERPNKEARAANKRRDQLRTLFSVDELMARVRRNLIDLGEESDTLVIFLSDNGYLWGEHNLVRKRLPYLGSTQVPLYLRWPARVEGGQIDGRLVANIDIAPTVLEAAGLRSPSFMDGHSLLDDGYERRELLTEYLGPRPWTSILTPKLHYIEWYKPGNETVVRFREFYDLEEDPLELNNLLAGPGHHEVDVARLSERLAALRRCTGRSCP